MTTYIFKNYNLLAKITTTLEYCSVLSDAIDSTNTNQKSSYQAELIKLMSLLNQHSADINIFCAKHPGFVIDQHVSQYIENMQSSIKQLVIQIDSLIRPKDVKSLQEQIDKMADDWAQHYLHHFDCWKTSFFSRPLAFSPIMISYRNDEGGTMHGAFYDHYTMRKITEHKTRIAIHPEKNIDKLAYFIRFKASHALGIGDQNGHRIKPAITDVIHGGLLFIPGRSRNNEDVARNQYEQQLIKMAMNRGQPILAICAGAWQLWIAGGGNTKEVVDHSYAKMPSILTGAETFGSIGNNKQVHRIRFNANTLVKHAMTPVNLPLLEEQPEVNSVHWAAVDESTTPSIYEISATTVTDDEISPHNRQGKKMQPQNNSVEAFEGKFGAPVMGIQWHPEAYFEVKKPEHMMREQKRHLNLINYMAKAGDAYQAKRGMLVEYNEKYVALSVENRTHFFKPTRQVSKRDLVQNDEASQSSKINLKQL